MKGLGKKAYNRHAARLGGGGQRLHGVDRTEQVAARDGGGTRVHTWAFRYTQPLPWVKRAKDRRRARVARASRKANRR